MNEYGFESIEEWAVKKDTAKVTFKTLKDFYGAPLGEQRFSTMPAFEMDFGRGLKIYGRETPEGKIIASTVDDKEIGVVALTLPKIGELSGKLMSGIELGGIGALGKGKIGVDISPVYPHGFTPVSTASTVGFFAGGEYISTARYITPTIPKQVGVSKKLTGLTDDQAKIDQQIRDISIDLETKNTQGIKDALNANSSPELIEFAEKYATKSE